jgi:hypothetical protein
MMFVRPDGSDGNGSTLHLITEMLEQQHGLDAARGMAERPPLLGIPRTTWA